MNFKKYHVSKNLFDKDNATVKTLYIDSSVGTFRTSSNARTVIMPCEPNTTYTISKMLSARFSVVYSAQIPVSGDTAKGAIDKNTGTNITITTDNDARYLSMFIYNLAYDTATFEDIENSIMVNLGSTPFPYEPYSSEVWHDIPYYLHNTSTDTITTLPADIYANDTTATVGLKGQSVQSGAPTPQAPIMPNGTGERTGNLFDKNATDTNNGYVVNGYLTSDGTINTNNGYRTSEYIPISSNQKYITYAAGLNAPSVCFYDANKNYISGVNYAGRQYATFTTPSDTKYVRLSFRNVDGTIMFLNLGDTPLPYEPYGIKIPISSANTTTPVYLGEVESTRRVKKLVFDGTETGWRQGSTFFFNQEINPDYLRARDIITCMCSHYQAYQQVGSGANVPEGYCSLYYAGEVQRFYIKDSNFTTLEDFQTYLAAQYAAGTPVCVWYVLAEPTTGIVNSPLMKIGEYADTVSNVSIPVTAGGDTLSVDTTVQPSEVTVNYKGWHDAQCKEYDGSQWV